ncbi:MAG: hypothetical protein K2X91_02355, partial [Thermoleophilia bacterium]|nr:hypothetical protein [Thermoleophilia bacterium]
MTNRSRTLALAVAAAAVVALASLGAPRSSAQIFVGAGSTAEGDILRGGGVYLWGAGQFNLYTSMAQSIQVDTWMRLNEYIYQSLKLD